MSVLTILPLPIGVLLAIALMWNEIKYRNKTRKYIVELEHIRKRYEE